MDDILREIRQDCRQAMNGIVSTSMREYGMDYKLNFGLVIAQIKELAAKYGANAQLAERLWSETTRELKILATFVYPINEFKAETANKWVAEIPNQEMREQVCFNLFQELDFADQLALDWMKSEDEKVRTTGYWLLARLLLTKKITGELTTEHLGNKIWVDVISEDIFIRNASSLVLKHMVRKSKDEANIIFNKLLPYKSEDSLIKQEAFNAIAFEIDFMYL